MMSNMPAVQVTLSTRCNGQHRHIRLEGGTRTKQAQKYPNKLCEAIVEAIKLQKRWDSKGVKLLGVLEAHGSKDEVQEKLRVKMLGVSERHGPKGEISEELKVPDEEEDHKMNEYFEDLAWDDMSGKYSEAKEVKKARADEID